ncbi:MAG: Gfo/Idh/MocA family oxidoreductase [Myxococcales bacterium]|nr:Gfo/Idh/MocA family oxidoreductase [Myxococcales bacterium]
MTEQPTEGEPIRTGIVGLGKMGISHFAIVNAHPDLELVAVADTNSFLTSAIKRYTKVEVYKDFKRMINEAKLDAVLIATPTRFHFEVARYALERGINVFVEKPFTLTLEEGRALVDLAKQKGVVNQVGFHNHFVGTFAEVRRLVNAQAIGEVYHVTGEAYGQVVTKPKTSTWRSKKSEGGGCLHDYASHVVDLMNWVVGPPVKVLGAHLNSIFSEGVDDAVHAVFEYKNGMSGQLTTNWSDTTYRKMTTRISINGKKGKIIADRQEVRVFLMPGCEVDGYGEGWSIKYITDLQKPVWFYMRGEEYSTQIDTFAHNIKSRNTEGENTFASAYATDEVLDMIQKADRARS